MATRMDRDDVDRLAEIRDEIADLVAEAANLLRGNQGAAKRAEAYCLGQIERALGNDAEEGSTFDPAGASLDSIIAECEEAVTEQEQEEAADDAEQERRVSEQESGGTNR